MRLQVEVSFLLNRGPRDIINDLCLYKVFLILCIYVFIEMGRCTNILFYYYSTLLVPACHTPSEFLTTLREQALPSILTRISKYHKNIYIIKSHLHLSVQYVR